jgi:hypothetical protein
LISLWQLDAVQEKGRPFHKNCLKQPHIVMPGNAGIQKPVEYWIPACAGMTTILAIDRFVNFGTGSSLTQVFQIAPPLLKPVPGADAQPGS